MDETKNIDEKQIVLVSDDTSSSKGVPDDTSSSKGVPDENYDPRVARRVLLKTDAIVCVILTLIYTLQYMDKVSNSVASIMGIRTDLHMHDQMYSWVGSAFYLGYLAFQLLLGNLILQRLHIGLASGTLIVIFGVLLCCMGAVHNYASFIALRVLQGLCEGCITPTFVLLTAQWYRREEQFGRSSAWFAGVGAGAMLVDALAYGLYTRESNPMTPWRLVFVILGACTIAIGIIYLVCIPSDPSKAWFLTSEEKVVAVERTRENQQGLSDHRLKFYQIREALYKDPRTWIYFAIVMLCNVPNGGITNFNQIIINNMGYSVSESLLMDLPSGAVQLVGQMSLSWLSLRFFPKLRMVWVIGAACLNVMSLCFLAFGSNGLGLAGYYIWSVAGPVCYVGVLSSVSSNSAGRSKKAFTSSLVMVAYSVGNLVGSQTFRDSEAPSYPTAKTTMVGCSSAVLVLCVALLLFNIWTNKRRDARNEKLPPGTADPLFLDLTDFENPEFRYAL